MPLADQDNLSDLAMALQLPVILVVGVRLGFSEAQGYLSGDINRMTGNIAVDLYGKGSYLATQMNCAWYDLICASAKGLVGGAAPTAAPGATPPEVSTP